MSKIRLQEKGVIVSPEVVRLHQNPPVAVAIFKSRDAILEALDVFSRDFVQPSRPADSMGHAMVALKFVREHLLQLAEQGEAYTKQ